MRRFVLLVLLLFSYQLNSQGLSNTIENVRLFEENKKVIVMYDLISENAEDTFFVDLKFYNSNEKLIIANSISGDLKITAGKDKRIEWNVEKDGWILDEYISLEINAFRKIQINKKSHVIKSLLVPGLGDYKIRNGKLHFLTSILAYGSIGSSVYFNSESLANYQAYKQEYELEKSKMLYERAILNRNLSLASAGIAASVWVVDYALLNLRIKKSTRISKKVSITMNYKINLYKLNHKKNTSIQNLNLYLQ